MDERKIENLKVFFREKPVLYEITKVLYYPVRMVHKVKLKIRTRKKANILLNNLNSLSREKKYIFFCGVPIHQNLGDAAQMLCIRQWIAENFAEYTLVEIESYPSYDKRVRRRLENFAQPQDIFITESGATFSDRHEDHGMHRYLLKQFPKNRILMMPETVDFSNSEELQKTAKLFNAHGHALFLARDKVSYDMVQNVFDKKRVMIYPDIVTTMIGQKQYVGNQRHGILICKRIDGEKCYTDKGIEKFLKQLMKVTDRVDITDTNFEDSYEYTMNHLEEVIRKKIDTFASYEVLVTDRFHGMIFSLIANTPVVVLPTKGHKVREGAKWFKENYPDAIYFCESLDDAKRTVDKLLTDGIRVSNQPVFKEKYYDVLKQKFDELTMLKKTEK